MKNELGIEVKCKNCKHENETRITEQIEYCIDNEYAMFEPKCKVLEARIKELQEQQFTTKEAEKIETFLIHGYQMLIGENKKIFSKLEKIKGTL